MDTLCLKAGIPGITPSISGAGVVRTSSVQPPPPQRTPAWGFSFRYPLRSLWPTGSRQNKYDAVCADDAVLVSEKEENKKPMEGQNGNWVLKILHVRSLWKSGDNDDNNIDVENLEEGGNDTVCDEHDKVDECDGGCDVEEKMEFDKDSFSKLLKRVSLAEARLYAQMSYLGNLAYAIPQIKPGNLLKYHGLRFVTSSLEKKEQRLKAENEKLSVEDEEPEANAKEQEGPTEEKMIGKQISASAAYQIAASAASYLHSQTKTIIPFKFSKISNDNDDSSKGGRGNSENVETMNANVASLMATTDSVTAVVAAKEEVKQAVADDLNSIRSSPCEWFICDDDQSATRFFVIQGSETMASWQANLLFEPIQFEGLGVLVHRGIYEAAKGIYEQMLPEVHTHLKRHGDGASFRFTGHSLGGSLSLLVNLMLLIRGQVPSSSLLPVITFGAPSIMCGGDHLLRKLGLPRNHLQAIIMHRDIVPRAFSCNYPNHVAELLKAVNGNFRNHPCLSNQSLLYAPMGEFLILQPDEKFSPNHELLPSGTGLYLLTHPKSDANDVDKQVRAARTVFLNSPHPLEILSDRSAYGSEGTIHRDHDMNSYLRSVRNVIRHELNRVRRARREHRRRAWWPLVSPRGVNASVVVGRLTQGQLNFSGVIQSGRESFKRFSRLVASQHMHLVVVFLLPARVLILGVSRVMSFH